MGWLNSRLQTKALYWAPPERDGRGGYIWTYPDEILCRWRRGPREIRYNDVGATLVATDQVLVLNTYLNVGGYLMKGDLYSIQDLSEPPLEKSYDIQDGRVVSQEYARQVVDIEAMPSIDDRRVLYKLWLT